MIARPRDRRRSRPSDPRGLLLHRRGGRSRRLVRPSLLPLAAAGARGARGWARAALRALAVLVLSRAVRVRPRGGLRLPPRPDARDGALRHDDRAPQLRPDVRLRDLLAGDPAPVDPLRERLERPQPVARARRRGGVGDGAWRARGATRARLDGSLGQVPGGGGPVRVRRARARTSDGPHIRERSESRSRSTRTGRSRGWRCTAANRGHGTARASPSPSGSSRGSLRSRCGTGRSSFAGRSRGSRVTTAFAARCSSSRCSSGRRASTASLAPVPGKTCSASCAPSSPARRSGPSISRPRSSTSGASSFFVAAILATYLAAVAAAEKLGRSRSVAHPRLRPSARPHRRGVPRGSLLHALPDPGPVHHHARLRPVRARLGSPRDGGLRAESRHRVARDGVVRPGRCARRRARRGSGDRA